MQTPSSSDATASGSTSAAASQPAPSTSRPAENPYAAPQVPLDSAGSPAPAGQSRGIDHHDLPPLSHDPAFWGMSTTQFLGAFNDNLFKQLILLLAVPTAAAMASGAATDRQGTALAIFSAPFLLFSGFAGYVADRFSKRTVVVTCKVAEIGIMSLGLVAFALGLSFEWLLGVLFLMGTHSAFFGPAKYGILPEMLRAKDLPRANGNFLMLTFLAIIFGTALAGVLLQYFGDRVYIGSACCVGIAVLGTLTSLAVRKLPTAQPNLPFRWSSFLVPPEIRRLMRADGHLTLALLVTSLFWMVGGLVQPSVNALGKVQMGRNDQQTSILAAGVGFGLALGCMLGGFLSRRRVNPRVVQAGAWGIVASLIVMSLPGGEQQHLLGYYASFAMLVVLGTFTGMFVVPIQVALQSRPPEGEKGRVIAVMNQCNWIGIILAAGIYAGLSKFETASHLPPSTTFLVAALIMLPIALLYRPEEQVLGD